MAAHNMPEAFAKAHSSSAADFTSVGGALGGAMSTKRPVQITDLAATEAYKQRHPKLDDRFHEPDHGTGDLLVDSSFAVR
jgi:hypothetical protein